MIAVLFFYFVTCPCSSRTKRHDNLFVDDDDDQITKQLEATAMYHHRNTAHNRGRKHRRRKITVEDTRMPKMHELGLRQTSIGMDSDSKVGQRPDTLNPFGKSGSHVGKTRIM